MTSPFTLGRHAINADGKPFDSRLLRHAVMACIADPTAVVMHPDLAATVAPHLAVCGLQQRTSNTMLPTQIAFLDSQDGVVGAITNLRRLVLRRAA